MKIKNILFDLDGTLADSAVLTMKAMKGVAPDFALEVPSKSKVRAVMGYANPEFYLRLFPLEPPEKILEFGNRVEEEEGRLMPEIADSLCFDGCRCLLDELLVQKKRLFIVSTGAPGHVFPLLDKMKIRQYFTEVLCGQEDKSSLVASICSRFSGKSVMVGDMKKDCEAAHSYGIPAIGAAYGYSVPGRDPFDRYIEHPLELMSLLEELELTMPRSE